jgi:hypothetical protein
VRTAREITFLEANVTEHTLYERNVLRLAAMRRARHGELLLTPAERVEAAGVEERQDLKGLGAGAPIGERLRLASSAE